MSTTPDVPLRDPSYDELWDLLDRLATLLNLACDAGYLCDVTVSFTGRDAEILAMVDRGRDLDGPVNR